MTITNSETYLLKALEAFTYRRVVVSPDFRILAAPPPAVDKSFGDATGRYCHEVFFGRESPCEECGVKEVLETGKPTVRFVERPDSGESARVQRHLIPIKENGVVEAVAILDLDTAYFEGLGQAMGAPDAFLKNLIQSSADGIIASDMKGNILIFNEAASRMTGWSQEEALRDLNIRGIYPGDGAREVMRRLRSDDHGGPGKLNRFRVDAQRKDGVVFPIDLSAAVVYDCGKETATVGFFYDLREKLRMERELQHTQVQLMQAEKMSSLGKLSAGVAHQLNNPIGSIVLFSQLLLEDYDLPAGATADVQRIIDDAARCQQIVAELLDFARQTNLEIRPHDVNRALNRTLFLLEKQPLFRDIEIVKELSPDLPSVPCDVQQLNHVFMNIILNAADAMDGRGRLTVKTRRATRGDRVVVEIADTGPGIPNELLPHIFDPFFTTKEQGKGTGLGLSVAYGVIEHHGGRITACSAPGEGASFVIELLMNRDKVGGALDGNQG